jgi:hypothetical protein
MRFPHFMALAAVLLTSFGLAVAQTPESCPLVSVEGPAKQVDAGMSVVFRATLKTVVPTAKPEFEWKISAGTITAGQGTSSITVDTVGLGGQQIVVTVSVSGVSTVCSTSVTHSLAILQTTSNCGMAFDEFGDIRVEDEEARLDNLAIQLTNYKQAVGAIIVFAGRKTYENEAIERLKRAKDYLVKVRNIEPDRVVTVDGGYRKEFQVSLYIIPPGAQPPSFEPRLDPSEVELTKPRPRIVAKKRG